MGIRNLLSGETVCLRVEGDGSGPRIPGVAGLSPEFMEDWGMAEVCL